MFDTVVSAVYGAATSAVSTLLADALVDVYNMIDKIVYVGGKRDDCICLSSEEIKTPFHVGRLWEEALVIQQRLWLWMCFPGCDRRIFTTLLTFIIICL